VKQKTLCDFIFRLGLDSFLWPPRVADAHIIHLPCSFFLFLLSFLFLACSQPSHIWCLLYLHTWCDLSANLGCRSEMCCMRLAENTGRKKSPYEQNRTTLSGYTLRIKAHIDNRKKTIKQQYLLQMSPQYGELRPTSSWDRSGNTIQY